MTLLVISDSHGNYRRVEEAVSSNKNASAVLFLGDGLRDISYLPSDLPPVISVRGNCDLFPAAQNIDVPSEHLISFGEYTILLMHGHLFGVKSSLDRAAEYAASKGADILLFGHTHIPLERYIPAGETVGGITLSKPLRLFNPGSIGRPICESRASFGIITIRGRDILLSHGSI